MAVSFMIKDKILGEKLRRLVFQTQPKHRKNHLSNAVFAQKEANFSKKRMIIGEPLQHPA